MTTLGQTEPGSNDNEEYSTFPSTQELETYNQMQFSVISRDPLLGVVVLAFCKS